MHSARPSAKERALLYSLWSFLALIGLLYCFWPEPGNKTQSKTPVKIAPELQVWFAGASLVETVAQGLVIELLFHDKPLDSLQQIRSVHLGYDLGRESETLFRGTVVWNPGETSSPSESRRLSGNARAESSRANKRLRLLLPNPQATAPLWIRLYFADSR